MAKIQDTVDSFALKYAIPIDLVERICASFEGGCKFMHIANYFVRKGEDLLALDILHLGKEHYENLVEDQNYSELSELGQDIDELTARILLEEAKVYQRLGFYEESLVLFNEVEPRYGEESEYLGLRASLFKSMAFDGARPDQKSHYLTQAQDLYYQVYKNNKSQYWHGINTILVNFIKGDLAWTKSVLVDLERELKAQLNANQPDYWLLATLAEVMVYWYLLTDEMSFLDEATELYTDAQRLDSDISKMRSSVKNINLLLQATDNDVLKHYAALWFPKIQVIILPGALSDAEKQALIDKVSNLNLPDVPKHINVIAVPSATNRSLLQQLAQQVDHVDWLYLSSEDFNKMESLYGKKAIHARDDDKFWFLSGRQLATNSTVVKYWHDCFCGLERLVTKQFTHYSVTTFGSWIDLDSKCFQEEFPILADQDFQNQAVNGDLKSFIMGDLSGYSKYNDFQVRTFAHEIFSGIAKIADQFPSLIQRDGWGDAFYFVFDDQNECVDCALQIRGLIEKWQEGNIEEKLQLPAGISMRIAIDTAPLTQIRDHIENKTGYTGTFVSRVARMEPITPIGAVYCGIGCALLALKNDAEHICFNYMGINSLPKKYGVEHVFKIDDAAAQVRIAS